MHPQVDMCLLVFCECQFGMLGKFNRHLIKNSRVLTLKLSNFIGNCWVHGQGTDRFCHWHTLVLLDIACRNGMYHHIEANIFDAWLVAGPNSILNTEEIFVIV